jgi:hypothetical protein
LITLATLAGCAQDPVTPAPAPVVVTPAPVVTAPPTTVVVPPAASAPAPTVVPAPTALRAGFGRIESISAVPPSAAAGGTTTRRLGIKMEDGTVQYVDTSAPGYSIGDRIELTKDGTIRQALAR